MRVLVILTLLFSFRISAVEKKGNVIYKYKQYESFDLGNLEIKGNILAPGDLSVRERERKVFMRDLLDRKNFEPEINEDIRNLR